VCWREEFCCQKPIMCNNLNAVTQNIVFWLCKVCCEILSYLASWTSNTAYLRNMEWRCKSRMLTLALVNPNTSQQICYFKGFRKIMKSEYYLRYVCPHGTTRLPLDRFSLNLKSEYCLKKILENSNFHEIGQ